MTNKTLLELIKQHNLTIVTLAKQLNISTAQIYQWNKNGISETNKHYTQLKTIIPELTPKTTTTTKKGNIDKRSNSGRPKKVLNLYETDIEAPPEERSRESIFPKIKLIYK